MSGVRGAGIKWRAAALTIDLGLFVITSPLTLGVVAVFLRPFWVVGAIALGFTYYFVAALSSQSVGMQLLGLRIVSAATGRPPHATAAAVQSICILLPLVALFILASAITPTRHTIDDGVSALYVWLSVGVLALAFIDHVFAIVDDNRRSLHDHLTGLAVVQAHDVRPAHHPIEI